MKAVSWRFRTAEKVAGTLSAREVEVLRLLSGPLSLRDIGKELFISHDTVKSHVKAIYHKLGVSSRKEAVALSRKLGLFPDRQNHPLTSPQRGDVPIPWS